MSSTLNYFIRADKDTLSNVIISSGRVPGISDREVSNIAD